MTGANARLISRVVSSSLAAARATRLGMSTMCYPAVARVQSSVPTASVKFWDPEPATMSYNFELVHKNHDARERDARCSPRRRARGRTMHLSARESARARARKPAAFVDRRKGARSF